MGHKHSGCRTDAECIQPETMNVFTEQGATRWAVPPEMAREAMDGLLTGCAVRPRWK